MINRAEKKNTSLCDLAVCPPSRVIVQPLLLSTHAPTLQPVRLPRPGGPPPNCASPQHTHRPCSRCDPSAAHALPSHLCAPQHTHRPEGRCDPCLHDLLSKPIVKALCERCLFRPSDLSVRQLSSGPLAAKRVVSINIASGTGGFDATGPLAVVKDLGAESRGYLASPTGALTFGFAALSFLAAFASFASLPSWPVTLVPATSTISISSMLSA